MRKIVHIDMDAFYASVEQRDNPALRGKPVVVAWRGARSVVCAASYEARRFGVHSAMPAVTAERRCPQAVFVAPDFSRYKAASRHIRSIFARYTDAIEPLSLDEAYLDVSADPLARKSATALARRIRAEIAAELHLAASAGIAPNKFLAKIASDWRKPNGQFTIPPSRVKAFLEPLPVARIPGVGKVTQERLARLGVRTVGELRGCELTALEKHFGRHGVQLYELARGVDERPVQAHRETRSVSHETTFEQDQLLEALEPAITQLCAETWQAAGRVPRRARTVALKLKTDDFHILTRSHTPAQPPPDCETLTRIALDLRSRVGLPPTQRYRLVGVGLANFDVPREGVQGELFTS
ncbi:MAG: DNA polymerase IV [Sinobacteraceae bacterium]|nr:DNA polymerase IV [Nevskiaceae bacterium]